MAEIAVSVAAKVAEYLVGPIIRPLGYLFNYRRNITDLNQQIHRLDLERERLQIPVDEANGQGDEIFRDVQEWLTYAEGIIQKRDDFNECEQKASKSCFYLKSRYQLSKQAKKQAAEIVDKIQEAHNFGKEVSYSLPPPPPPIISAASFKDYEVFDSRESTSNQIMEALRNEDMSMIGVWGMGGVGKTTLVKQVAQQAEKDKLFHKVVMALNISQTPNIAEIQEKIARMLGLKFKAEDDRADRLSQRLKKEEKILVILDDIWEKLELGKIGIPYGDDHKGCKVLLTSRERQVLSKDMRIQKEFHLQHLSEEEAWNLFKKIAGDSEPEKRELPPIAVDVAKECGGLPVAIVTIASALRGEKVPVWKNALEELKTSAPTSIRGVDEKVYACLELSYNHLKGNEVKSLFLLCALMGDDDISMDHLLQNAMGLNLFKGISWDNATNKLITLVENLKASSLLLDGDRYSSLFFDESMLLRMHDLVRDVARSIASKDPHQFVVKEDVGEQEEWQWMDEYRNCTRISLKCKNIRELPQGLVCPKLEFFLLGSSNDNYSYLEIPDAFLQDTKQLRVLDLSRVFLPPSPSSLGFLSNLRTLCLNHCVLEDIAVIGDLKRLQVLSLAGSEIEQLPKEMMQLSDLRVLDLRNCYRLKVIPRNVISSLSRLEYLSMESFNGWEKEGFNGGERINNACVTELKHLSGLRSLEVEVRDPSLLPEDDVLFDNLNLTRYSIQIGEIYDHDWMPNDEYNASRELMLYEVKSLHMVKCFSQLLKRSQAVKLWGLNDTEHVVYELDKEGFVELKYLSIFDCDSIQYILHSSTSVEWTPPPNTFHILEKLYLIYLNNLEAVCHGPIPTGSFGNLRILEVSECERLNYIISVPTEHGREPAFPQLQSLTLKYLIELISFYSIRSSGNEESVPFFNQQAAFPSLEFLSVYRLDNLRVLWHKQLPADSFSKLKQLRIDSCNKLLYIFPSNILKGLQSLQILSIGWCCTIQYIIDSTSVESVPPRNTFSGMDSTSAFPQLQKLVLIDLDEVISFYSTRSNGSDESVTFFNQQTTFPALESLHVLKLDNVRALWPNQLREDSFSKLKNLDVTYCNKLLNVFPLSMVKAFVQLEDLYIGSCGVLEAIVANENEDEDEATLSALFPKLTSLKLTDLPQLKRFCFGRFTSRWSLLKKLEVSNCDKVEIFFQEMGLEGELDNKIQQPLFVVEKVAFPSLEFLYVDHLDNLRALWPNQLPADSFSKLKELKISSCNKLLNIFSSNILKGLQSLQILKIHDCDALKDIFDLEGINGKEIDDIAATQSRNSLFTKNLRGLLIFQNLQSLEVNNCPCLKYVFPIFVAKALVQLEDLRIDSCGVEAIVANEDDDEDEAAPIFLFPRLISLKLKSLYQLQRFYLRRFTSRWPILKELEVCNCDKVEVLFQGISLEDELDNKIQQSLFFVKKEAFPNLEELRLTLKGIVEIWQGQFSRVSFSKLRVLNIKEWHGISIVISSNMVQMLHNLERLEVTRCNSVNEVIQVERLLGEEFHVDTFSRLTKIYLKDLPMLMHFYGLGLYFQSCQTLEIDSCGNLINLVTPSMAKRLVQLERLIIRKCHMVEEIVGNEGDEPTDNEIDFNRLEMLELDCLPNLKSFCSARYTFQFPSLEIMKVTKCPEMKFFCKGVLNTPKLKGVQMSGNFLEECWEGDLNTIVYKKFMEQFEALTESEGELIEDSEGELIEESE